MYISHVLKFYPWYHGMMFGQTVEKLLKWDYAYLVRRAMQRNSKKVLCLSVKIDGKICHFTLNSNKDGWSCGKLLAKFPKITPKRFQHIHHLLDAWSLVVNSIVPVPRRQLVLQHNCIHLENILGNGAFGEVLKARYIPRGHTNGVEVAVKRVIGTAQREQMQEFCHEAQIMGTLKHDNVVKLYGIASLEQPIMLVMELITGGDLKKYLQSTPSIPNRQLIAFALDIANGMRHLVIKKVIHRDLAARNCLISRPTLQVKISDFGLAVQATEVIVKKLSKAPTRWLAPETFQKGIFNEKTDVWSFGVVLTEILTRCAADPLAPRTLEECKKYIIESPHPHRIENKEPKELAELVEMCCDKNTMCRANFQNAKRRLKIVIDQYDHPDGHKLELKKSEEQKRLTIRRSTATVTRKKSRDGGRQASVERKGHGTQRKVVSVLRKDKGALKLPSGIATNLERPSPPSHTAKSHTVKSPMTPPVSQPPVSQPPVSQPPVSQPPVSQPPVSQPPVPQHPMTPPPASSARPHPK
ncbi:Tyrosine-protein kinase [Caenorhabditis elegans]|nr:Tyrosine-protein kinase [Caenorhabditis elegans]CAJ76943.1 Tyrosine-protein kinase [Caenorhabditis elegans]|eukprot:NP_001040972.1 Tyrosine-protein kinase [Caenorhabditis elegans]